ncbi:hypothetical protein PENSPDRAFT_196563 [Peniophora sp. CONT]|nr:hypothetical protein PENSPDRAFT_196563 [Peniophora sp. CONT]
MSATSAALDNAASPSVPRPLLSEKRKQDIRGAVQAGVEIASFVATVTQNVPYLGVISSSLTEIMKMCDEVEECEGERKAVKGVVGEIREIVDATHRQCDELGEGDNIVPTTLVHPLARLQGCIDRTQKALDDCGLKSSEDRDGRLRAIVTQGKRLVRKVASRHKFLGAMRQCRADMSSTLDLFSVSSS